MPYHYYAEVSGSTVKPVLCDTCGCAFIYRMGRRASVQGRSNLAWDPEALKEGAADEATTLLDESLRLECEPVPCPRCGNYQPDMVREL
ncbi:MAG: hypothetical protein ACK4N5_15860, partial [Myxococcales bacterium]